jgi:hypothetical protein
MIDGLTHWFMQDPLKNFLLIFGSGGLLAACFRWGSIWADRRRIRVRLLSEHYDPKVNPTIELVLRFEVTNVGEKATSLETDVVVWAVAPDRDLMSFVLPIQEADRQLPPHAPKQFTAKATVAAVYLFCWFKRYRFRVLRGRGAIIRYRNAMNEDIPVGRYWWEYSLFRWFGWIIAKAA